MKNNISRRRFFDKTIGISAGAMLFPSLSRLGEQDKGTGSGPMIICSRTTPSAKTAVEKAWEILKNGGSAVDA